VTLLVSARSRGTIRRSGYRFVDKIMRHWQWRAIGRKTGVQFCWSRASGLCSC